MAALPPFSTSYRQQPSIGAPSSVFRQNQIQARPPSALDLPGLQSASRVLHDQFMKDAQIIPDIGDMLTTRKLGTLFNIYFTLTSFASWWAIVSTL
jgi:nuclear pore complex protein Nup155